ncbi:hypothetical protein F0562_023781 [Nyssa sinensis]|uniref:MULE transposase domain-containing protein n=1 Tax=Nyssa sinensis TaxID=561372 RepID=A0A5J5BKE5_9ASTE|nr:hypothetical protein F0562_023781 [Nyssa sinensis]
MQCDNDVLKMVTYIPLSRVIEVYLEHVSAVDFLHNQIGSSNAGSSHVVIEEIDIRDVDYSADRETQGAIVKATKGISLEDNELETVDFEFIDSGYSINDDDDELFEKNVDEGMEWGVMGIDGNNAMFPLAYVVVKGETKSSWLWFLELLQEDLGIENQNA